MGTSQSFIYATFASLCCLKEKSLPLRVTVTIPTGEVVECTQVEEFEQVVEFEWESLLANLFVFKLIRIENHIGDGFDLQPSCIDDVRIDQMQRYKPPFEC